MFAIARKMTNKRLKFYSRPFCGSVPKPRRIVLRRLFQGVCLGNACFFGWFFYGALLPQESDEGLPLKYDPDQIAEFWNKHPARIRLRVAQIVWELLPYLLRIYIAYKVDSLGDLEKQKELAVELRLKLQKLGPTFIKLGQAYALRPDVVPQAALRELEKLCDQVPSYSNDIAMKMIEEELGKPIDFLFDGLLGEDPIAAASLGQVYRCRIKGSNGLPGAEIALKVQRPDMVMQVSRDMYILRRFLWMYDAYFTSIFTKQDSFHVELLDRYASATYRELDYILEGTSQEYFRDVLRTSSPEVVVPKVFWSHTTRKVLASQWIEGEKLIDSDIETIARLVPIGVKCFLDMLLEYGFFHCDPHPGNILVTEDGKVALLDFGLCATIEKPSSKELSFATVNLVRGNFEELLTNAINLGFLKKDVDRSIVMPALTKVLSKGLASGLNTKERRVYFHSIQHDLNDMFFELPFSIPPFFGLLARTLTVLEGIALRADPNFDIFMTAYPYMVKRIVTKSPRLVTGYIGGLL